MDMLLPTVGVPADAGAGEVNRRLPRRWQPREGGQAPRRGGRAARARDRGDLHRVRPRGPAAPAISSRCRRPRSDDALRAIARLRLPVTRRPHPALPAGRRGAASTCAPRCAGRCAAAAGRSRSLRKRSRAAAAAAGDPVRHLGLDGPLHAHVPAFHARDHQRPRPGLLLPLRHAAEQRHPRAAQPGRRRGAGAGVGAGRGLVRRHAHRPAACTSSTTTGRAGCWARAPSCC